MKYISWATFYEGPSDALYLDILLPRMIRDLIYREGTMVVEVPDVPSVRVGRTNRSVDAVALEACAFRDAIDVIFIHADTGGRGLERGLPGRSDAYCSALSTLCEWPTDRCITITPRHETEAWLIADGTAVTKALGYTGNPSDVGLPGDARAAERLPDPKQVLTSAIRQIAGRRRRQAIDNVFPAIAQRQRLDILRQSNSFTEFESRLRVCLHSLGCLS